MSQLGSRKPRREVERHEVSILILVNEPAGGLPHRDERDHADGVSILILVNEPAGRPERQHEEIRDWKSQFLFW